SAGVSSRPSGSASSAGRLRARLASQYAAAAARIAPIVMPSAVAGTPTYFRPDAKIANVIAGLM
ncbi:MAG: hypothetical protein ACRDPY_44675, partial [Streptosporangiaceae bacterium]